LKEWLKIELHTFSALEWSSKEAGSDSTKKLAQKRNSLTDYLSVQKSLKVVKKTTLTGLKFSRNR
jgi:hypothetical protein